jgi:arylsulfatase A-like enzyme
MHPTSVRLCLGLVAATATASLAAGAASTSPAANRPNVVVILADDMGWGDVSLHGNPNLATPNLDTLARAGAAFDRFYVCSVCAPTRAEFLTGRYHPRTGVRGVSTGQERLNTDERTLADVFKAAGYRTGAFGKWHNGSQWPYHPNARGFEEYVGFTSGHWGEYFDPPLEHNGRPFRARGYIADVFTDRALAFIEENRARPFLCYLPFNTPHSPWAVPAEYWQRFKDKPIALRGRDGDSEDLPVTRVALAMVENLDWNVGRVLRKLDDLRLADNTIVVFFCDNGPNSWRWNGDMKGRKGSTDEGGVRSPLFVRWPGRIKPGAVVRELAGAIDLLPTLTKLAGVPLAPPKPLDGADLSPLLVSPSPAAWPDRLIFSHQNGRVSARSQQYRLDDRGALFDMVADPGQRTNIAAAQPAVAKQMAAAVAAWRADVLPKTPDNRPFPVGYREFPRTPLPARDGIAHGGVQRSANAPNSSYFVNWRKPDDSITWDIEVRTAGDYEVTLHYTCPEADAGSTVELSFQSARLSGKVTPGWDPPRYTNQDTIPRPEGESRMKEFRPLRLGTVHLEPGRGLLTVRATQVPGASVMDLRQVDLILKTQP